MKLAELFAEANSIEPGKEKNDFDALAEKLDKIIELLGGSKDETETETETEQTETETETEKEED